jgi:hypothetical protein
MVGSEMRAPERPSASARDGLLVNKEFTGMKMSLYRLW